MLRRTRGTIHQDWKLEQAFQGAAAVLRSHQFAAHLVLTARGYCTSLNLRCPSGQRTIVRSSTGQSRGARHQRKGTKTKHDNNTFGQKQARQGEAESGQNYMRTTQNYIIETNNASTPTLRASEGERGGNRCSPAIQRHSGVNLCNGSKPAMGAGERGPQKREDADFHTLAIQMPPLMS